MRFLRIFLGIFSLILFSTFYCEAKPNKEVQPEAQTLIIRSGATDFKPGLAKAWQKMGDSEYKFTLDLTRKLRDASPLTAQLVKKNIEGKMGKSMNLSVVSAQGDTVVIKFAGPEHVALGRLSALPMMPLSFLEAKVEVLGAKPRKPKGREIRGGVMAKKGGNRVIFVYDVPDRKIADEIQAGKEILVKDSSEFASLTSGHSVYFTIVNRAGNVWEIKDVKNK